MGCLLGVFGIDPEAGFRPVDKTPCPSMNRGLVADASTAGSIGPAWCSLADPT